MTRAEQVKAYALEALGSAYVYGGTGRACTPQERQERMRQYPQFAAHIRAYCRVLSGQEGGCLRCAYAGKRCFDCAQLVKRAFESAGISLPSGASTQWLSGNFAYKGAMAEQAKQQVCLLFRDGASPMRHVGISLGDGRVVDARGHRSGVILSLVQDYPWTHYAIPVGMDETTKEVKAVDIKQVQQALMRAGISLPRFGADGKWGRETQEGLRAFQRLFCLKESGQPDAQTLARLQATEEPVLVRLDRLENRVTNLETERGFNP